MAVGRRIRRIARIAHGDEVQARLPGGHVEHVGDRASVGRHGGGQHGRHQQTSHHCPARDFVVSSVQQHSSRATHKEKHRAKNGSRLERPATREANPRCVVLSRARWAGRATTAFATSRMTSILATTAGTASIWQPFSEGSSHCPAPYRCGGDKVPIVAVTRGGPAHRLPLLRFSVIGLSWRLFRLPAPTISINSETEKGHNSGVFRFP